MNEGNDEKCNLYEFMNNIQDNSKNNNYSINDNNQYDADMNYDAIIDIDSIRFLKERGWKIIYPIKEKENDVKLFLQKANKSIVSILGHSNRGKTYILQRICGVNLKSGYQIQTRGLSIKIPEKKNIILLDTAGTNAPLLIEDKNKDHRKDKNFQIEMDFINLCQIITNYIIQTFIIKEADTLICVVGMLTASEQQFLNKVKKNCRNIKNLIVIHNLIKCFTKKDIERYKTQIFFPNIINKYDPRPIPQIGSIPKNINISKPDTNSLSTFGMNDMKDNNNLYEYYIEKDVEYNVRHFIFGNDESEEIKCYNNSTIAYIRDYIDTRVIRETKIIDTLIEHINTISTSVLKNELKITNENLKVIKCNEEIEPKEIIADELDNITFIGKDYEPSYRYYKMDNQFIIEIDICSKLKENSLKVKHRRDKDSKEYEKFKISGERLICGEKKNEDVKVIYNFINKRENLKKFNLNFKVKLNDFDLRFLPSEYVEEIKFGILFIYFKI